MNDKEQNDEPNGDVDPLDILERDDIDGEIISSLAERRYKPDPEESFRIPEKRGELSDDEWGVIKSVIDSFHDDGLIAPEQMWLLEEYVQQRILELGNSRGDARLDGDLYDHLVVFNQAIHSTKFVPGADRTLLLDASSGTVLLATTSAGSAIGLAAEILAEIILIGVQVVGPRLPRNAVDVVKETAQQLVRNPRIRGTLRAIIRCLQRKRSCDTARLKRLLFRLFGQLGELPIFKDLLKRIWQSLSWWDVALMILDLLLLFTPVGWAKKGAVVLAGILGLAGSIVSKLADM